MDEVHNKTLQNRIEQGNRLWADLSGTHECGVHSRAMEAGAILSHVGMNNDLS